MERMVNQNAENEIYHDFRYWEDKSDEYRNEGDGTLLPLWRFASDKVRSLLVKSDANRQRGRSVPSPSFLIWSETVNEERKLVHPPTCE